MQKAGGRRQPTHRAYSVIKREGQDDYWLNLGLAFPHKVGRGFNIMLQVFPLDGKIVCREVVEDEADQQPPRTERNDRQQRRGRFFSAEIAGSHVLRGDLLDKPNNRAAQFRVFDEHEGLHQRQAIRRGEKIGHVGSGDSGLPSGGPEARRVRPTLEEERNRHPKDLGNMLQSAGADAIGALLVLLKVRSCPDDWKQGDGAVVSHSDCGGVDWRAADFVCGSGWLPDRTPPST
jgi:hypothetical protein